MMTRTTPEKGKSATALRSIGQHFRAAAEDVNEKEVTIHVTTEDGEMEETVSLYDAASDLEDQGK